MIPTPQRPASLDSAAPAGPARPLVLAAHPVQGGLREQAASAMSQLAEAFDRGLDSALQALLAEARNAAETRAVLELGDALQLGRAGLARRLHQSFLQRLNPLAAGPGPSLVDIERLSVRASDDLEETIALAQLAQATEQRAGELGLRLRGRLSQAARRLSLPALAEAFEPGALGQCFAAAFRELELDSGQRILAYRLVETLALPRWAELLAALLAQLDQLGLDPPPAAGDNDPGETLLVAEPSLRCLRRMAAGGGAREAPLAAQLLAQAEAGGAAQSLMAAAGQWFDSLLAEPHLPVSLLPALETLRYPLLKLALADRGFYLNATHSLRRELGLLCERLMLVGASGQGLGVLQSELVALRERISMDPGFVRDLLPRCQPLSQADLQAFFTLHRQEQLARQESALAQLRRLLAKDVEAETLGVDLPPEADALLSGGFMPLMARARLAHGAGSVADQAARQLLAEFTASFAAEPGVESRDSLIERIAEALRGAGLREERVGTLMRDLESAYRRLAAAGGHFAGVPGEPGAEEVDDLLTALVTPGAPAPTAPGPPPSVDLPLASLLRPEQWYRVRDPRGGDDRWLCLAEFYPRQDLLSFRASDGVATLGMRVSRFVEDLLAGRAEPLNPDSEVAQALRRQRSRATGLVARLV